MLRRLLAALLVAAVAMPVPALAVAPGAASVKRCPMVEHAAMGPNHRCCCNDSEPAPSKTAAGGHEGCAAPEAANGACGCLVKADPGTPPVPAAATSAGTPFQAPAATAALLPASLSTPRREPRAVHLADPPPAPGLVSRPLLCSWTL